MTDRHAVDEHLVALVNGVLDAVYQAKQVSWAASTSPGRADLQELVSFLIEQSGRFMEAEEKIDGRSAEVSSPSSHQRGNLVSEAHGDHVEAVSLLVQGLQSLAGDARSRAALIGDAPEVVMLTRLADGVEERARRLRPDETAARQELILTEELERPNGGKPDG